MIHIAVICSLITTFLFSAAALKSMAEAQSRIQETSKIMAPQNPDICHFKILKKTAE